MSYGKLNIWLRFEDCSLIQDCWMTDLVIKSCTNIYLVRNYPQILKDLQDKYPDLKVRLVPDYELEDRIRFGGTNGYGYGANKKKLNPHIEVNVPPGCYIIWTRVCHGDNEETNKVLVTVNCGQEVCVNLLLNGVETCARQFIFPGLAMAKQMKLNEEDIKAAARVLAKVANIEPKVMKKAAESRLEELKEVKSHPVLQFSHAATEMIAKMK
jgi:hypothetical protein